MNMPLIALVATLIGFYAYYPYLRDIFRGRTHPHIFTWAIWTILMTIGFAAQMAEKAGPGAWVTGLFAILNALVLILALKYGERGITRGDRVMLGVSLLAIPLWLLTQNPLWSVILISLIDVVAFIPTFRKSWSKPHEETLETYVLIGISFLISLFALEKVALTTVLYPGVLIAVNLAFIAMVAVRRQRLRIS